MRIQAGKLILRSDTQPRRVWGKDILRKRLQGSFRLRGETFALVPIAEDRANQLTEDICREAHPCIARENGCLFPVCLCEDDNYCDPNCSVVIWETNRRQMILDLQAAFFAMDMVISDRVLSP